MLVLRSGLSGEMILEQNTDQDDNELEYHQPLLFEEKAGMRRIKSHFNSSVIGSFLKQSWKVILN
jgi:hypothetical protein